MKIKVWVNQKLANTTRIPSEEFTDVGQLNQHILQKLVPKLIREHTKKGKGELAKVESDNFGLITDIFLQCHRKNRGRSVVGFKPVPLAVIKRIKPPICPKARPEQFLAATD